MTSFTRPLAFYVSPRDPELESQLAWLADHGIRHIGTSSILPDESPLVPKLAALIEKYGLSMTSVHAETGLLSPSGDDADIRPLFLPALTRAKTWGAECVVYHFRSIHQPWKPAIWWHENAYIETTGVDIIDDRQIETLKWLCDEAAKFDLSITLENVPIHFAFAYRVDEIANLVNQIGAPNLGICLDSGHAHLSGLDVPASIRTAGQHLLTTHFHDGFPNLAPRTSIRESDLHLVPGLGTINWPEVLRALNDVGYQSPITFEGPKIPSEPDPRTAWDLTLKTWPAFERLAG